MVFLRGGFFAALVAFAFPMMGETLKGVVLLGPHVPVFEEVRNFQGVSSVEVFVPRGDRSLDRALFPKYSEAELDAETVASLKEAIYDYYRENGFPFIILEVPSQKISTGILQFVVLESRVGKVEVVGDRWAAKKSVQKYIGLKPGDAIAQKKISRELDFMNRNTFRSVRLIYSPGEKELTTDLTFDVQGRMPYQFYAGIDNTGIPTTGRNRVFLGFSWDQVFGFDQTFFYQYTTNYERGSLHAHTAQYVAYMDNMTILNLYGGFSSVKADIAYPNRSNKGRNIQVSLRYRKPLKMLPYFSDEFVVGFDWKQTNNNIEYIDALFPVLNSSANLTQFMLGYQANYNGESFQINGGLEFFGSPMKWLPDQSDQDFSNLRPGAKNRWLYLNGFFDVQKSLWKLTYKGIFSGKFSSNALLPSELLGIGGYGSVRGYDERELNVDAGFFFSQELYSPSYHFSKRQGRVRDSLEFLLFVDAGWGNDYKKIPTVKSLDYLLGAGPGVRYQIGQYFKGRLDWGIKLHQQENFTGGWSMLHFSAIGSF